MEGLLGQIYLLNDPFNNFPNFKLIHTETSLYVEALKKSGFNSSEIVFYEEIRGPIKIWEISYTGKEEFKEEYLDKDASKYITWKL